jgi:hypothetical protein
MIYLVSWTVVFLLVLILPVLALIFFWLSDRYNTTIAYVAVALVPLVSFTVILKFPQALGQWAVTLLPETLWLSLIIFIFGLVLAVRAFRKKQNWIVLLAAAVVSIVPFALVALMLYQMSRDDFLKHL